MTNRKYKKAVLFESDQHELQTINLKCTSAEMKLFNIHIKNLIILSVSGIFKGSKNSQKVAKICYQLVHDRGSRGLALFPI